MSLKKETNTLLPFSTSDTNSDSNLPVSRDELFDLYKIAIETDRFEIDLGWKLVQFFLLINSGLLTIGFTLISSNQIIPENKWILSSIFIVGIITSCISIRARKNYHERSLVASCKKVLIEKLLELYRPITINERLKKTNNLAISTSPEFILKEEILEDPVKYVKENVLKKWSVPYYHVLIFHGFIVINLIGILITIGFKILPILFN